VRPIFPGFNGSLPAFIVKSGLENPRKEQQANADAPGEFPNFFGGGFHLNNCSNRRQEVLK
jgi:hypothetical protein